MPTEELECPDLSLLLEKYDISQNTIEDNKNLLKEKLAEYGGDDLTKRIELNKQFFKAKSQPNNWGNFFLSFINPRQPNCILYIIIIIVINSNIYYMFKCSESKKKDKLYKQQKQEKENNTNIFSIITDAGFKTYSSNNERINDFLNYFSNSLCENKIHGLIDKLIFILSPFILLLTGLYSFLGFIAGMIAYLFINVMNAYAGIAGKNPVQHIIKLTVFFIVCMLTGFFMMPILIGGLVMAAITMGSIGIMPVFKNNNSAIPKIIKNNVFYIQALIGGSIVIAAFMNLNNTISKPMSYTYLGILVSIIVIPFIKSNFMPLIKKNSTYRKLYNKLII
jgi:hypothetical protein